MPANGTAQKPLAPANDAGPASIPVYSMRAMGVPEHISGFNIQPLEERFTQSPNQMLRAHRHDHHHALLVNSGSGRISMDFQEVLVRPPMLLQFGPGVVHGWSERSAPRGYVVHFDRSFFAADARDPAEVTEMPLFCALAGPRALSITKQQHDTFEGLAGAMLREYRERGVEHAAALRSYLRLWLIEAQRIMRAQSPKRWNDRGSELANRFLRLVSENFLVLSGVAEYAERLHVTPSHLNETVRRTLGKTAGHLIRERVALEAKRMLRHSEQSVAEVAYHLNFEDPSYFARFFRKQTGISPASFRNQPAAGS
jgi:AraC family transcriptional regulator, transcriptional activator of pobA